MKIVSSRFAVCRKDNLDNLLWSLIQSTFHDMMTHYDIDHSEPSLTIARDYESDRLPSGMVIY